MGSFISFEQVCFSYESGGRRDGDAPLALRDLSLDIDAGSFVAVLGHNGSGKSTLAKHLNAILLPVSGRVTVDGMDTADASSVIEIRRRVGMVFQNPDNQIVATLVEEDVAFALENLGVPPAEIRVRVDAALRDVGMYEFREHAPHRLSGGQKQRVAIAGVLAMRPRCIVFDEPTAMLDPAGRQEVISTILSLRREYGVTVVLVTHHMDEAALADRVVVMNDGGIYMDGAPRDLFSRIDELGRAGLAPTQTVALLDGLRSAGWDIGLDALTVDGCARAIKEYLDNAQN